MTPEQSARESYCPMCERAFLSCEVCPTDGTRLVSLVAQRDPFVGRDLDGRYLVAEKLGQGGMGAVYRGTQTSVDRDVAIKVVNPAMIGEPDMIKRFLREAKLASKLNHPHAVSVLDFGQTRDGVFYLVMELIRGRTLAEVSATDGRLTPTRVVAIGIQVLGALEGAHAVPIVHRDLKPANIMVGPDDFVKVLDFGIAKSIAPETVATTMTNAGAMLGTPHFMPPEIANGDAFDCRADLYSLGCILYLLVEGRLPYNAATLPELLFKHAHGELPPLRHAPLGLARVIEKLLAKEPSQRYATATVARVALEHALSTSAPDTIPAPSSIAITVPVPARALAPTVPATRRWPIAAGALVVIVVGVGAAVIAGRGGKQLDVATPLAPHTVPIPDPPASTRQPAASPPAADPAPSVAPPVPIAPPAVEPETPVSGLTPGTHRLRPPNQPKAATKTTPGPSPAASPAPTKSGYPPPPF